VGLNVTVMERKERAKEMFFDRGLSKRTKNQKKKKKKKKRNRKSKNWG